MGKLTKRELHHSCRMESVLALSKNNYLSLIMPAKLLDFLFQPIPVFVGNLAQNSTILSLSNKSFLLIRSCVFLCSWHAFILLPSHANNTLNITFKHETIAPRIFWCVSLFFQNYAWSHMFTKIFLGIQSLVQKQKSCWCLSETNEFWKFRWFLREVTIHLENPKKKNKTKQKKNTMKWLQKLSFIWMNNEKSRCILAWKQGLPIQSACVWDEERLFFW